VKAVPLARDPGAYAVCTRLLGPRPPRAEELDTAAGQPENRRMNRTERVAVAYGGKLVRRDGRLLLASFPTANAALLAACEMQRRCLGMPRLAKHPLSLHVGIHRLAGARSASPVDIDIGERRDGNRRFGFSMAMFLAGKASRDGVVVSGLVFRALAPEIREQCRPLAGAALGTSAYALDWDKALSLQTQLSIHSQPPSASGQRVLLRAGARHLVLDRLHVATTFGRDPACDVAVSDNLASREHAHLEIRPEGCILTDHSTNGTSVVFRSGHELLLRNESFLLEGRGRIGLGRAAGKDPAGVIEFRVQKA
jgi:hypothetical protein